MPGFLNRVRGGSMGTLKDVPLGLWRAEVEGSVGIGGAPGFGKRTGVLAGAEAADPLEQFGGMVGLGEELVDVQLGQRQEVGVEDRGTADQDGLVGLGLFDPPADLDAGEHGEIKVQEHQAERAITVKPLDPLAAIPGLHHLEALMLEKLDDQSAELGLVFDEQEGTFPIRIHDSS
jgi:hypothetical protein